MTCKTSQCLNLFTNSCNLRYLFIMIGGTLIYPIDLYPWVCQTKNLQTWVKRKLHSFMLSRAKVVAALYFSMSNSTISYDCSMSVLFSFLLFRIDGQKVILECLWQVYNFLSVGHAMTAVFVTCDNIRPHGHYVCLSVLLLKTHKFVLKKYFLTFS